MSAVIGLISTYSQGLAAYLDWFFGRRGDGPEALSFRADGQLAIFSFLCLLGGLMLYYVMWSSGGVVPTVKDLSFPISYRLMTWGGLAVLAHIVLTRFASDVGFSDSASAVFRVLPLASLLATAAGGALYQLLLLLSGDLAMSRLSAALAVVLIGAGLSAWRLPRSFAAVSGLGRPVAVTATAVCVLAAAGVGVVAALATDWGV